MKAFPDTFIVPRLPVFIAGLLMIVAIVSLSQRLFADRLVEIVAAVLSVFVPQRWLQGTTPLSDIYYYLAMLVLAGLVVSWLRDRDDRRLLAIARNSSPGWRFGAFFACVAGANLTQRMGDSAILIPLERAREGRAADRAGGADRAPAGASGGARGAAGAAEEDVEEQP